MPTFQNTPLRAQVHQVLQQRILHWEYQPGTVLQDTVIAAELQVSRTPVREALLRLAKEGLVDARQGRGFQVRALQRRELEEVYPILWTLEGLALALSPRAGEKTLQKLSRLNAQFADETLTPRKRVQIDADWHTTLVSECANGRLLEELKELRLVARRHELGYMRDGARVTASVGFHERIARALRAGDRDRARALLEEHWRTSLAVWLSAPAPA